ncbi:hypothetical protein F5141DRAFT_1063064 [Pisolithus sp. B1]|nr:hypothetical protein F5141DRAFT_1063064 [Pisolithus sp. B1]
MMRQGSVVPFVVVLGIIGHGGVPLSPLQVSQTWLAFEDDLAHWYSRSVSVNAGVHLSPVTCDDASRQCSPIRCRVGDHWSWWRTSVALADESQTWLAFEDDLAHWYSLSVSVDAGRCKHGESNRAALKSCALHLVGLPNETGTSPPIFGLPIPCTLLKSTETTHTETDVYSILVYIERTVEVGAPRISEDMKSRIHPTWGMKDPSSGCRGKNGQAVEPKHAPNCSPLFMQSTLLSDFAIT